MWLILFNRSSNKDQLRTNWGKRSRMTAPSAAKYAIIGAGIHGLSTALHLAQMLKASGRGSGKDIS